MHAGGHVGDLTSEAQQHRDTQLTKTCVQGGKVWSHTGRALTRGLGGHRVEGWCGLRMAARSECCRREGSLWKGRAMRQPLGVWAALHRPLHIRGGDRKSCT